MQGKAEPVSNAQTQVYVGVDVCKDWLDAFFLPVGESRRFANDPGGIKQLNRLCRKRGAAKIVMEATGKYHRSAHRALSAAGLSVAVVNPLRARLFAEVNGALAKTDAIDARMLAMMAEKLDPKASEPPPQALEELQELVRARQAAVAERTALMNRRGEAKTDALRTELDRLIEAVREHIERLEKEIDRRIRADATLKHRRDLLTSIPGIGPVAAAALLADLDELGACSNKSAAMLVGLAPLARDSGQTSGKRRIRGGRALLRAALYMPALAAKTHNPPLKHFHDRLIAAGKQAKVALTAVMRKLVVIANTLIREDRPWTSVRPVVAVDAK
jgi:transposase